MNTLNEVKTKPTLGLRMRRQFSGAENLRITLGGGGEFCHLKLLTRP